jgi:hypothetical protein
MTWMKLKKHTRTLATAGALWATPDWLPSYTHDVIPNAFGQETHDCSGFGCASRDARASHREDRVPAPLPVGPP